MTDDDLDDIDTDDLMSRDGALDGEAVYYLCGSNDSAYRNAPDWINRPTGGYDPEYLRQKFAFIPPGRFWRDCVKPFATGSGFPALAEPPILEFVKKPTKAHLIDVFVRHRDTLHLSDHAKDFVSSLDPEAFEFLDTETRIAGNGAAPHYWLCDVVRVLNALDLATPGLEIETRPDGRPSVYFAHNVPARFKASIIGEAKVWRGAEWPHDIFCRESFRSAWRAVKPNLRGVIWMKVGAIHE